MKNQLVVRYQFQGETFAIWYSDSDDIKEMYKEMGDCERANFNNCYSWEIKEVPEEHLVFENNYNL